MISCYGTVEKMVWFLKLQKLKIALMVLIIDSSVQRSILKVFYPNNRLNETLFILSLKTQPAYWR